MILIHIPSPLHLLLPDLGVQELTGDRDHPVPPALHPDEPGLHLPPPPLHLLLGDIELLQLSLPSQNLTRGTDQMIFSCSLPYTRILQPNIQQSTYYNDVDVKAADFMFAKYECIKGSCWAVFKYFLTIQLPLISPSDLWASAS